MSNTALKLLVISIFLIGIIYATQNPDIRPTHRVTEPDKLEQHVRADAEPYRYLSELNKYWIYDWPQYGTSATDADQDDTIYLATKYNSSSEYVVMLTSMSATAVYYEVLSDSSFRVISGDVNIDYSYLAIGVKQ